MELKETPKVPMSEFSQKFVQGMLDRMGMSYFKYGKVSDAYPGKLDAIESALLRINKYKETGNTEYLMDAGNFVMIEFMHPKLKNAYFQATDSDKSPGRVFNSGHVGQEANTIDQENVRLGGSKLKTSGGFYKTEGD